MAKRKARVSKIEQAKRIIRSQVKAGNQRSKVVHNAVKRAGISTRTYRTARKQMGTKAVRHNSGTRRGRGTWYVSLG